MTPPERTRCPEEERRARDLALARALARARALDAHWRECPRCREVV